MHVLNGKISASRATLIAGMLALSCGLAAPVFAEDPAPSSGAPADAKPADAKPAETPPAAVQLEPAPEGTAPPSGPVALPTPGAQASTETDPCFTGNGSIKEVLDACAAFLASGSTDTNKLIAAHGNRALGFSATGDYDNAIAEMDAALKLDPSQASIYFMRAAAYEAKSDHDKALADLDEAIRIDATRGDFYMLRGIVFNHKGDLDRAITELNQKVKLDPQSTDGFSKRAELYRLKKDYDSAVKDYSEVIKLKADDAKGYIDRGWIYVLKNDLDPALADFMAALKLHQNDASALVGVGLVKSRKGKSTDGSREIQQAITLEPDIIDRIKKLGVE